MRTVCSEVRTDQEKRIVDLNDCERLILGRRGGNEGEISV